MKAFVFIAVALTAGQPPVQDVDSLQETFRAQQAIAIHDIRISIQADLERSGAHFFAAEGGLQKLLDRAVIIDAEFAAR